MNAANNAQATGPISFIRVAGGSTNASFATSSRPSPGLDQRPGSRKMGRVGAPPRLTEPVVPALSGTPTKLARASYRLRRIGLAKWSDRPGTVPGFSGFGRDLAGRFGNPKYSASRCAAIVFGALMRALESTLPSLPKLDVAGSTPVARSHRSPRFVEGFFLRVSGVLFVDVEGSGKAPVS